MNRRIYLQYNQKSIDERNIILQNCLANVKSKVDNQIYINGPLAKRIMQTVKIWKKKAGIQETGKSLFTHNSRTKEVTKQIEFKNKQICDKIHSIKNYIDSIDQLKFFKMTRVLLHKNRIYDIDLYIKQYYQTERRINNLVKLKCSTETPLTN